MQNQKSCPLSIVIPVFNEEAMLPTLFAELEKVCANELKPHGPIEIVLVNDGSTDKSWNQIQAYCRSHSGCLGVNLSRNFGHQLALAAGLETARGDLVVSMDADLQDPPAVIVGMIEACRRGYDVVYATRRERGAEPVTKRLTAHLFYFLIEKLSGTPVPHNTGDFRLLSRRALTELSHLRETHRFIRGLVPWIGFPQTQVFYDRADRVAGETHYPFRKMLRFAFDGIVSMSAAPLRMAYVLSLLLFGIFVGYILYVVYDHFVCGSELVPGWTSIMSAITIFGAIQLLLFGVFGEYLGRIYEQSKGRPLYIVQEIVPAESETPVAPPKS
ncbi:MAG: glycosyltransferase family 2 protein [Verrucomicrobiia bacterium]